MIELQKEKVYPRFEPLYLDVLSPQIAKVQSDQKFNLNKFLTLADFE